MSEENVIEEALDLAKEAQSAKVFNLSDAIKGRSYPTTSVRIYLDDESALKLVDLNKEMSRTPDPEEFAKLEEQAQVLAKKVMDSSLEFTMRGVGQAAIEAVNDKLVAKLGIEKGKDATSNPEYLKEYITTLVGMNIVSVQDANGAVDETPFDYDKAEELRSFLPVAEWNKLVSAMQKLTLAGGYFDQLTDAGFLQKS